MAQNGSISRVERCNSLVEGFYAQSKQAFHNDSSLVHAETDSEDLLQNSEEEVGSEDSALSGVLTIVKLVPLATTAASAKYKSICLSILFQVRVVQLRVWELADLVMQDSMTAALSKVDC